MTLPKAQRFKRLSFRQQHWVMKHGDQIFLGTVHRGCIFDLHRLREDEAYLG